MSDKYEPTYRPGTVGYYLKQYGWEVVPEPGRFPLWTKNGITLTAQQALYEVYREIWRARQAGT